jgi:hypothetical protein
MHAISKDSTHFPYASIYCQIHIPKGSLQSELYSQQKQQNNNNDAMEQDKSGTFVCESTFDVFQSMN